MNLPGKLNVALSQWMAEHGRGSLGVASQGLSEAYRKGQTSSTVSLAAYVATRVPATFEANRAAHRALSVATPEFAPETCLDIGAGPGVASWAALSAWTSLSQITQCEQDTNFAELATRLNAASDLPVLSKANVILKSEVTMLPDVGADLVVASYMLAELPLDQMAQVAVRLWTRAKQVLLLLEPGTPQGFARLRAVRDTLLGQGACVLAPCTHQNACPMSAGDWCHFKTRVQRSREHMHAKNATVPFEDEAYSYLILARQHVAQSGARIIAPPVNVKFGTSLRLCDHIGLHDEMIASRDKATYKRTKKKIWGDVWE